MTISASRRALPALRLPGKLLGPLAVTLAAMAAAIILARLGLWALLLPVYAGALTAAVFRPTHTAFCLLVLAIVFEPNAIDFTRYMADAIYQMPPGWEQALGLTTSPIEVVAILVAISLTLRRTGGHVLASLPAVAWAIPAVIVLGLLYGLYRGAPGNLAYTEVRGLIAGLAVFVIAMRCGQQHLGLIVKATAAAVAVLAAVITSRYLVYVKFGETSRPLEGVFSHEGSVIMGVGLVIAGAALMRSKDTKTTVGLFVYCLLVFGAMIVTGRRAATLVVLVAGLSVGGFSLIRRPALTIAIAVPVLVVFGAYLGAFWNKEYGALAQPARAIRSQIDPTPRDDSSDTYRLIEKTNVIETVRVNRVFGVGFGRPFIQFQQLPDLTSFWPLQFFTPHQSVLWLWLKMGWLGISVVLGFVVVLLKRCLEALQENDRDSPAWSTAAVLFTVTLMFVVYSTVDIAFAGARQLAPMAVAAALILQLKTAWRAESND